MLTLADLGVLRDVALEGATVVLTVTPTYSGCPALATMRDDLVHRLRERGFADVDVRVRLAPAWSSDWITERGRARAARARDLPARRGPGHRGPHRAAAAADAPAGRLPALRVGAHGADLGVRRDGLQGDVPLRGVPRALRPREGDLMARARFHELRVAAVDPLTDDSAAITFAVPEPLRAAYDFAAGQALTLRRTIDGEEHRRSYSICAPAGAAPRVGVREIPGGLFSTWLVREVVGDVGRPTRASRAAHEPCAPTPPPRPGTCASPPARASPRCSRSPRPCSPTPTRASPWSNPTAARAP